MDDKRIEEMLRESLSPSDETMVRVERRARQELHSRQTRPAFRFFALKPMLAAAAILVIIFGNISDYHCRAEIIVMTNGADSKITAPLNANNLLAQRRQMEKLLTQLPTSEKDLKGVI